MYNIMVAENPEFKFIADTGTKVLNNTFIMYCDENGIKRFEKLMSIIPAKGDSLELRKSKALIAWNNDIPYTLRALFNNLAAIQGDDNIQIVIDDYTITIVTHMDKKGQIDSLWDMFESMIPSNMHFIHKNLIECNSDTMFYVATGATYGRITASEYIQWFGSDGHVYVAVGLIDGRVTVNEFTQYMEISGNAYVGTGVAEVMIMANEYTQEISVKGGAGNGVGIANAEIIQIS